MNRHNTNISYDQYVINQINRSSLKLNKTRGYDHWLAVYEQFRDFLVDTYSKMVCLGVRSGEEVFCFQKIFLGNNIGINVFGTDINPRSAFGSRIFCCDFNNNPEDWENKFDVVYSNSIDHAYDVEKTLEEWIRITSKGGILVIQFGNLGGGTSESDLYSFSEHGVNDLISKFSGRVDKLKFCNTNTGVGYLAILRKL